MPFVPSSPFGVTRAGSASVRDARCATLCVVPSAASWFTDEVEGPPISFNFPACLYACVRICLHGYSRAGL